MKVSYSLIYAGHLCWPLVQPTWPSLGDSLSGSLKWSLHCTPAARWQISFFWRLGSLKSSGVLSHLVTFLKQYSGTLLPFVPAAQNARRPEQWCWVCHLLVYALYSTCSTIWSCVFLRLPCFSIHDFLITFFPQGWAREIETISRVVLHCLGRRQCLCSSPLSWYDGAFPAHNGIQSDQRDTIVLCSQLGPPPSLQHSRWNPLVPSLEPNL